jgi:hypothetical protein
MRTRAFLNGLKKMDMLGMVNFPEERNLSPDSFEVMQARRFIKEEIVNIGHRQNPPQVKFFQARGEGGKLLRMLGKRFFRLLETLKKYSLTPESKKLADRASEIQIDFQAFFTFCPDAYAMTMQDPEDVMKFSVTLCTPLLGAMYLDDPPGFQSWDEMVSFLDSVLVHEMCHCIGPMKHDAEFKDTLNAVCGILGVNPI